jgi:hypothetical protein
MVVRKKMCMIVRRNMRMAARKMRVEESKTIVIVDHLCWTQ